MIRKLSLLLAAAMIATPASAAHFASLRRDEVFLREGPSPRNRVLWIYRRKNYPVEVTASYETWRQVRDADGTTGWISANMLSDARTVLVMGGTKAAVRSRPRPDAAPLAWAEPGVVAKLGSCKPSMCQILTDGLSGWIDRTRIWGVSAGEIVP